MVQPTIRRAAKIFRNMRRIIRSITKFVKNTHSQFKIDGLTTEDERLKRFSYL
jgi:hypothetical protein